MKCEDCYLFAPFPKDLVRGRCGLYKKANPEVRLKRRPVFYAENICLFRSDHEELRTLTNNKLLQILNRRPDHFETYPLKLSDLGIDIGVKL